MNKTHNGNFNRTFSPKAEGVAAPLEPWRQGSQVPTNIYEGDRPICQTHTALDAKRIVEAVNAAAVSKNLQEELSRDEDRYRTLLHQRYENMAEFRFQGMTHEELTRKLAKISGLEKEIAALREKPTQG